MSREVCGICWCPYDDNGACGCKPQTGATMNRDDILRMAREANRYANNQTGDSYKWHFIRDERFTALVAAAEREACAQIADAEASIEGIAQRVAAAIRARGNT